MRDTQVALFLVPTFNGHLHALEVAPGERPEFGPPQLPVLVRGEAGLRIVLGSHDSDDMEKPDIKIERQPNGWAIFLHPDGGGDPCGYVYFHDDGRSFLATDAAPSSGAIEVLPPGQPVPEFHVREIEGVGE